VLLYFFFTVIPAVPHSDFGYRSGLDLTIYMYTYIPTCMHVRYE
jgi:hypothetical protein